MKKTDIIKILRSSASVFTFKDIFLASEEKNQLSLQQRLHYYVQTGELYSIRRGFYAKDKNYNKREFSTKLYTPSYVSFETILAEAGMIFQFYSTIFVASYQSKELECDGQGYWFKKLKDEILVNSAGVENRGNYYAATKERAFLDTLYL